MADINATITKIGKDGSAIKVHWATLTGTNLTGSPFGWPEWADRTVQAVGSNFDTATVTMQGSCDGGTTWATLTDPQGNAIAFTANGIEAILEGPELVRPILSSAGGSSDVDIFMIVRRNSGMRT